MSIESLLRRALRPCLTLAGASGLALAAPEAHADQQLQLEVGTQLRLVSSGTPDTFDASRMVSVAEVSSEGVMLSDGRVLPERGAVPMDTVISAVELARELLADPSVLSTLESDLHVGRSPTLWAEIERLDPQIIVEIEQYEPVEVFIPEFELWLDLFRVDVYFDLQGLFQPGFYIDPTQLAFMGMVEVASMYGDWKLDVRGAYNTSSGDGRFHAYDTHPLKAGDPKSGEIRNKDGVLIGDRDVDNNGYEDWFETELGDSDEDDCFPRPEFGLLTGMMPTPYSSTTPPQVLALVDALARGELSLAGFETELADHLRAQAFALDFQQFGFLDLGLAAYR